jgi:hypothetical protein
MLASSAQQIKDERQRSKRGMLMVRVTIVMGDTGEIIGEFDFEHLPRNDDTVTIPWHQDEDGLRILDVTEVIHMSVGAPSDWGIGPRTVLRASETI